jgi:hypothetical protein
MNNPIASREVRLARYHWLAVVFFAIAMAWVEAAAVLYLRLLAGRLIPHQPDPLPLPAGVGRAEVIREGATLVMLGTVGVLAGRDARARIAYGLVAFGIWDLFYYLFLIPLTGWPGAWTDWDILFLIPLPWWGPVWAPASIAMLMVLWGTLVTQFNDSGATRGLGARIWTINLGGVLLALYVFMADALEALPRGAEAVRQVLPTHFNWPLFLAALGLMAAPIVAALRRLLSRLPAKMPL